MYIVYVRDTNKTPYSKALCQGYKTLETRNRNTLGCLEGETVYIARTKAKHKTVIVGTMKIGTGFKADYNSFRDLYNKHLVPPNSTYDCNKNGFKWCYNITDGVLFDTPMAMPENIKRHGFIYSEII